MLKCRFLTMFSLGMKRISPNIPKIIKNNYSDSALYISGQKANKTFATVKPYLDFDERLENENLEENLKLRGIDYNLKRLKGLWAMCKTLEGEKQVLQEFRGEISKLMNELMKDEEKYRKEIDELRTKAKMAKNDFLNIRDYLYSMEEGAATKILSLPNVLHEDTPKEQLSVVHSYLEKPEGKSKSHMEIASEKKMIDYINPMFNYLTEDAAIFEIAITNYLTDYFRKANYVRFSNSDFSKSVVVEGCGTDYADNHKVFTIEDPHEEHKNDVARLHLTGSGSLYAFMVYFTRHAVPPSFFPLKYFTQGRIYTPIKSPDDHSFFNLSQYSVITPFIATLDDQTALNTAIGEIQQDLKNLYENLGYHFRLVLLPANKLAKSESLRLSVQMMSNYLQDYVEVGHVSVYDSYLSKRLLFVYQVDKQRKFPKVISGTVFNVQKFLACALENNSFSDTPILTDQLKSYI